MISEIIEIVSWQLQFDFILQSSHVKSHMIFHSYLVSIGTRSPHCQDIIVFCVTET